MSTTSSSGAAATGTSSSPFPDPDLSGERGEASPTSTSVSSATAGCGCHVLRTPKENRRKRFLPYPKASPRRSTSRPSGEGGILTIGAPPRDEAVDDVRKMEFGSLFHVCSTCRRKISDREAVFMYGVLHAFCSIECRDKKMKLDGKPVI